MKRPFWQSGLLRLRVGRTSVRAEALWRGGVTWAGETTYATLPELSDAIARLAAEPAERCRRLQVTLERPLVQMRTLAGLPPVKQRDLAALVAHQPGRFFRKNGAPLVTDAVWERNGKTQLARAAAVEETVALAVVTGARAAGLLLESIAPNDEGTPLSLLPSAERAARAWSERRGVRRLAFAAVGLWAVLGGLVAARLVLARRAVERDFAALGRPLAAVLEARRELRMADATVRAVAEAERTRGRSLALLGAVTAALPDSAVLTALSWNAGGSGMLIGSARRAAEVVARLERGGVVAAPRLEGPVVREAVAGRGWERFTIVFGAAGEP
jgi:hypothetical protein